MDRKNMTHAYAEMPIPSSVKFPTNPMPTVISDQNISEPVMSHFLLKRSPQNPATVVISASVQESTVLIQPIWTSVRCSSSWIGIVSSPKSARSAWWKKNARDSIPSCSHL